MATKDSRSASSGTTRKRSAPGRAGTRGASRQEHVDREWNGSSSTGTAVIDGETFSGKEVTYHVVGDLAIFEGDIVLGTLDEVTPVADAGPVAHAVVISGSQYRWPGGVVPYTVDAALPSMNRITDAMAHWSSKTVITFVARTAANQGSYPNYVHFSDQGGCWSRLGMRGGKQDISLGSGCSTGNTIHEIGHTVGLWHEQSREDRDSFVTIQWANIDPAYSSQFDQHISDGDDVGAYDYCSIMHYPPKAFSKNNQPTIVPATPQSCMGQRTALSPGDIAAVGQLYGAKPAPKPVWRDIGPAKRIYADVKPPRKPVWSDVKLPRTDVVIPKQLLDPQPKPFMDPPWRPRYQPVPTYRRFGDAGDGEMPFALATPHHAAAAAAMEQLASAEFDTDPVTAMLAVAEEVQELAAALAEASAVLLDLQAEVASQYGTGLQ